MTNIGQSSKSTLVVSNVESAVIVRAVWKKYKDHLKTHRFKQY